MKKNRLSFLLCVFGLLLSACGGTTETSSPADSSQTPESHSVVEGSSVDHSGESSDGNSSEVQESSQGQTVYIPDENFEAPENCEGDLGAYVEIETITSVRDSEGNFHRPTVVVTGPDGQPVELDTTDNTFFADKVGVYTVTYTVHYGENDSLSKSISYTITVSDKIAPELDGEFSENNVAVLGSRVDLSGLKLKDNSGETINCTYSVSFGNEAITVNDNSFVADQKGVYVVNVSGSDSSGNTANIEMKIFTVVDGENGMTLPAEYHGGSSIIDTHGYNSDHAIKYGWTDDHKSYFHGDAMLSSDCGILGEPQYLSYWYYLDAKKDDLDIKSITKYSYYESYCYQAYGDEQPGYWQNANSYELLNNHWYLMVFDLKSPMEPEQESLGSPSANPANLAEVMLGAGLWDGLKGQSNNNDVAIYIDDIKVSNELPSSEDFMEIPQIKSLRLSAETLELEVGTQEKLTAIADPIDCLDSSVTWSSTDASVAKVSNGTVTALKEGTATVTATSNANPEISASCVVNTYLGENSAIPNVNKEVTFEHDADIFQVQKKTNTWISTNDLVDYAVGTGSYNDFTVGQKTQDGTYLCADPTKNYAGEPDIPAIANWRFFYNKDVGVVYQFKAKKNCFVSVEGDSRMAGWTEGTVTAAVLNADNSTKEGSLVSKTISGSYESISFPYTYIEAGQTFAVEFKSNGGMRNIQYPPMFHVAPVKSVVPTNIEEVKEAYLDEANSVNLFDKVADESYRSTVWGLTGDPANPDVVSYDPALTTEHEIGVGFNPTTHSLDFKQAMCSADIRIRVPFSSEGYFGFNFEFTPTVSATPGNQLQIYITSNDLGETDGYYVNSYELVAGQTISVKYADYLPEISDGKLYIGFWFYGLEDVSLTINELSCVSVDAPEFPLPEGFDTLTDYIYAEPSLTLDDVKEGLLNYGTMVDVASAINNGTVASKTYYYDGSSIDGKYNAQWGMGLKTDGTIEYNDPTYNTAGWTFKLVFEEAGYLYLDMLIAAAAQIDNLQEFRIEFFNGDYYGTSDNRLAKFDFCEMYGTTTVPANVPCDAYYADYIEAGTEIVVRFSGYRTDYSCNLGTFSAMIGYNFIPCAEELQLPVPFTTLEQFLFFDLSEASFASFLKESAENSIDLFKSVATSWYGVNPNTSVAPNDSNAWGGVTDGGINFIDAGGKGCTSVSFGFEITANGYGYFKLKLGAWVTGTFAFLIYYNGQVVNGTEPAEVLQDKSFGIEFYTYLNQGDYVEIEVICVSANSTMTQVGFQEAKFNFYATGLLEFPY